MRSWLFVRSNLTLLDEVLIHGEGGEGQLIFREPSGAQLETLLMSCAKGGFFTGMPMKQFGGSPLGYACYYGAKEVVSFMLSNKRCREIVDLNADTCPISGCAPPH